MPENIKDLNVEVAERIKNSSPTIKSAIVDKFVNEEVARRSDLLTRLIVAVNNFRKEAAKIKADAISFNADGSPASELWSKQQLDKRKKADEKLAKAEKAFDKALNENDYGTVEQSINELKVDSNKVDSKKVEDAPPIA